MSEIPVFRGGEKEHVLMCPCCKGDKAVIWWDPDECESNGDANIWEIEIECQDCGDYRQVRVIGQAIDDIDDTFHLAYNQMERSISEIQNNLPTVDRPSDMRITIEKFSQAYKLAISYPRIFRHITICWYTRW